VLACGLGLLRVVAVAGVDMWSRSVEGSGRGGC